MARDDAGAAGTVIVAFVLGALTGAAVALLVAPATGEETRRARAERRVKAGNARPRRRARDASSSTGTKRRSRPRLSAAATPTNRRATPRRDPPADRAETLCEQRLVRPVSRHHCGGDAGDGAGSGLGDQCGPEAP